MAYGWLDQRRLSVCVVAWPAIHVQNSNREANKRHYRPCNRTRLFFIIIIFVSAYLLIPAIYMFRMYSGGIPHAWKPFDNRVSGRAFCTPLFDHIRGVFMVRALEWIVKWLIEIECNMWGLVQFGGVWIFAGIFLREKRWVKESRRLLQKISDSGLLKIRSKHQKSTKSPKLHSATLSAIKR